MTDDLKPFVRRDASGHLTTDSRDIAEVFGRRHNNVLRDIERRRQSRNEVIAKFARLNFERGSYLDGNQQERPCYRVTAKGMAELTMSFSGERSCELRIRFIDAFESVADELADLKATLVGRIHKLEGDEAESRVKGRIGSKLMIERKREKPLFEERISNLLALVQGRLFHDEEVTA